MASRMVSLLGYDCLPEDFENDPAISVEDKETIKRTFLTCYTMERMVSIITSKSPFITLGDNYFRVLDNTPRLSVSDNEWFDLSGLSLENKGRSDTLSQTFRPLSYLSTTSYSNQRPPISLFKTEVPAGHIPSSFSQQFATDTPFLANAAAISNILHELTTAEKNHGRIVDLESVRCPLTERGNGPHEERLRAYLEIEGKLEDWYSNLTENQKITLSADILNGKLSTVEALRSPMDAIFANQLATRPSNTNILGLGGVLTYKTYCACLLRLNSSRLGLQRSLVREELSHLAGLSNSNIRDCQWLKQLAAYLETPPRPTRIGAPFLTSPNYSKPQQPPAFDHMAAARLRKSYQKSLSVFRNLMVAEGVIFASDLGQPFSNSASVGVVISMACHCLLEMYLTLRSACAVVFSESSTLRIHDVGNMDDVDKRVWARTWCGYVLQNEEGVGLVDENTCHDLLDELVAYLELASPILKSVRARSSDGQRNGTVPRSSLDVDPAIVSSVDDVIILHRLRLKRPVTLDSPSPSPLLSNLLTALEAIKAFRPPPLPESPSPSLARVLLKERTCEAEEFQNILHVEESLSLARLEGVLKTIAGPGAPIILT
ncbi:hypothetical protein HDU97_005663 [Phlyctochytrium planicorne]|nr:hypothetical protein HDU97_005663 [Phlyctochytrium planicorne]